MPSENRYVYLVCKTQTAAQRFANILYSSRIHGDVKRLPSEMRENNGCGWAVKIAENDTKTAEKIAEDFEVKISGAYLTRNGTAFTGLY